MSKRLPPLNALRTFEAAGRHLSFKKAAEELSVTPAAVGHQVKLLEDYLGVALFRRMNRAVLLTDAGQAALPELREGFDKLSAAVERIRVRDTPALLTLTVEPSFAARWLVRRLERFHLAHPDIDIGMDATFRIVDLEREGVDLAIRYGQGDYPGLLADKLLDEEVYPVCSPSLLEGPHPLREPRDLRHHWLLHDEGMSEDDSWPDWETWLRVLGVEAIDATRGTRFYEHTLLIEAAIQGQGVALAGRVVVADELLAGRLVRPFGPEYGTRLDFSYYLVRRPQVAETSRVVAFRDWLLAEVSA